ncbi:hypothetical protein Nepgr_025699 [Nepenthes gracilis]|uniref:Uncharacterized protein n=1 Tax=Nepenthes gracilis TaxID=150966 RepID=A0AAD3T889_NEPGR|nr:hypothetical protein Nepgr_025699 [Nepenthes gracilis]
MVEENKIRGKGNEQPHKREVKNPENLFSSNGMLENGLEVLYVAPAMKAGKLVIAAAKANDSKLQEDHPAGIHLLM